MTIKETFAEFISELPRNVPLSCWRQILMLRFAQQERKEILSSFSEELRPTVKADLEFKLKIVRNRAAERAGASSSAIGRGLPDPAILAAVDVQALAEGASVLDDSLGAYTRGVIAEQGGTDTESLTARIFTEAIATLNPQIGQQDLDDFLNATGDNIVERATKVFGNVLDTMDNELVKTQHAAVAQFVFVLGSSERLIARVRTARNILSEADARRCLTELPRAINQFAEKHEVILTLKSAGRDLENAIERFAKEAVRASENLLVNSAQVIADQVSSASESATENIRAGAEFLRKLPELSPEAVVDALASSVLPKELVGLAPKALAVVDEAKKVTELAQGFKDGAPDIEGLIHFAGPKLGIDARITTPLLALAKGNYIGAVTAGLGSFFPSLPGGGSPGGGPDPALAAVQQQLQEIIGLQKETLQLVKDLHKKFDDLAKKIDENHKEVMRRLAKILRRLEVQQPFLDELLRKDLLNCFAFAGDVTLDPHQFQAQLWWNAKELYTRVVTFFPAFQEAINGLKVILSVGPQHPLLLYWLMPDSLSNSSARPSQDDVETFLDNRVKPHFDAIAKLGSAGPILLASPSMDIGQLSAQWSRRDDTVVARRDYFQGEPFPGPEGYLNAATLGDLAECALGLFPILHLISWENPLRLMSPEELARLGPNPVGKDSTTYLSSLVRLLNNGIAQQAALSGDILIPYLAEEARKGREVPLALLKNDVIAKNLSIFLAVEAMPSEGPAGYAMTLSNESDGYVLSRAGDRLGLIGLRRLIEGETRSWSFVLPGGVRLAFPSVAEFSSRRLVWNQHLRRLYGLRSRILSTLMFTPESHNMLSAEQRTRIGLQLLLASPN
jgi:hypothetical protein